MSKELMDNARTWGEANWHNIDTLATTSVSKYFLATFGSPFRAATGTEGVLSEAATSSLIAYWKLDEMATTTFADFSGNGKSGTAAGGVAATSSCQVGGCAYFDGLDDRVSVPNIAQGGSVTVSAWLNQVSAKNTQVFGSTEPSDSAGEFALIMNSNGRPTFIQWVAGGGDRPHLNVTSPANIYITYGNWNHLVGVYDSVSGYAYMYLNGSLVASSNSTNYSTSWGGGIGGYTSYWFNGKIDDVRVYSRALTADEVANLYKATPYSRYFYVDEVNRDSGGNIVSSGGSWDPSTKKLTITANWGTSSSTIATYLTRSRNRYALQTDWVGGPGQEGPLTSFNYKFSTSTANINYSTTTGSVLLNL